MAALTTEQKRRIRKELQRRAQAKAAWKAGGGKSKVSASMKDWAGFGETGSDYHKNQLAYIKSLGKMGDKSGWKTNYKKAAATGGKAGKAKVEAYIAKKGAGVDRPSPGKKVTTRTVKQGGGTDISGNKPAPKVTKAGPKYTAKQKAWYKKHVDAGNKSKAFIKRTLDARIAAGKA